VKRIYFIIAALWAFVATAGFVPVQAQSTALTSQEFAEKAGNASQYAIAVSEITLKRSTDRKIRRLAQAIIDDYRTGNIYISEAAASHKLRVPDALSADLQSRLARLENASASEIDALFMSEMSQMHRDAIPLFAEYAQSGDNRSLRFLAGRALPTLRENYASVQQLVASR
jgi:putative membrane protein